MEGEAELKAEAEVDAEVEAKAEPKADAEAEAEAEAGLHRAVHRKEADLGDDRTLDLEEALGLGGGHAARSQVEVVEVVACGATRRSS